jgi:3,4-dihydroxy 2-butanone 4-phosphate synthase/GTP cyclohydrolase II
MTHAHIKKQQEDINMQSIKRIEQALNDLKQGKMIILTDHPDRENEGDLIMAAEHITPDTMNFMIRNGSGIVCVAMTSELLRKFELPLMVSHFENTSARETPFTISIDAKHGITTGVSSTDRANTIKVLIDDHATADDLVKPGHIFPLQAKENGVFERQGHTEGAVDLMKLIDSKPAAVLCEIMNPDGSMTRGHQLQEFADKHQLTMLSIDEIIHYRLHQEYMIEEEASSIVPLEKYGAFNISVLKEKITGSEHIILSKERKNVQQPLLVRIHSSCFTGDIFASKRCDCHDQLHHSLERISDEGGVLIYLNQEGRGIGLLNKVRAYALQEQGYDTVDANIKLGLPIDGRKYYIAASVLRQLNVNHVRLMTNNPNKISDLKKYGIEHVDREIMPTFAHEHNHFYLQTKQNKLNHAINLKVM